MKKIPNNIIKKEVLDYMRRYKLVPSAKIMSNEKIFSLNYSSALRRLGSLSQLALQNKIKLNKVGSNYLCDLNYFNQINSFDKAYFLGFLASDGHLRGYPLYDCYISILEKDRDMLVKFKKKIKSTAPIHKYEIKKNVKNKWYVSWGLGGKHIINTLIKHSITPKKTYTYEFPNKRSLPKKYIPSFIRGYFDGDGTLDPNKGQTYFYSGSFKFAKKLKKILKDYRIENTKIQSYGSYCALRINASGYYGEGSGYDQKNKKRIACLNTLNFYKLIYADKSKLYLKRKKIIFEKLFLKRNKGKIFKKDLIN